MYIERCWIADWPDGQGRRSGMVNICMRFEMRDRAPTIQVLELRKSKEDPTAQKHVTFGLLEERSLVLIKNAIEKYLDQRYMEDMAEHWPPR